MRRGGYLKRKTRLKSRGGSLFPHKRQPKFMAWMLEKCSERRPCDGCGQWHWLERAHLKPRGSGGADLSNLALLCKSVSPNLGEKSGRMDSRTRRGSVRDSEGT